MKIGIVCYPTLGGSGILATELAHALAECGHEVHVIAYEVPFRLNLESPRIYFHEVGINEYELFPYPDYALPLAVKIAEVAQDQKLDILHVHYAIPHATSAYLAKQLLGSKRPALVTTLHGTDITLVGRDPGYLEIVKFSIEKSDAVTAVSKSLRQQTIDYLGIKKEIEVIYNFFVPTEELESKKPLRSHFVSPEEKLLIHASNFRPVKRVEDVIRIFHLIHQQLPCKLIMLGSGSCIHEARKVTADLGLQKEVFFLGKIPFVDPYIASADLFLLPSSQESFGLAALEAMSYGVPVIATRVGGLPEVIEEGKTGFLSPLGDVEQMAKHAIQCLSDDVLYKQMSQACIQTVKESFSIHQIIPQYERLYERVLKNL